MDAPDLSARALAALSEVDLARLEGACHRRAERSASWFARWRWRRKARRVSDARTRRIITRMGRGTGRCERCREVPPTVHVVYGNNGAAERFGHFCDACSREVPTGWMVVAELVSASKRRTVI